MNDFLEIRRGTAPLVIGLPHTGTDLPAGLAHGYQTLEDDTRLVYLISAGHSPSHARTLRWDDPSVGIDWPLAPTRISDKDREGHPWPPTH